MTILGERRYWTREKETALIKIGTAARTKGEYLNWELGCSKEPAARELLKDKTYSQLSKAYTRVIKSRNNKCQRYKCNSPVKDGGRMCELHRKEACSRAKRIPLVITRKELLQISNGIKNNIKEGIIESDNPISWKVIIRKVKK